MGGAFMKIGFAAALALLSVAVSGCGSSVARPDVITAVANPQQKLAVVDVICTAASGVTMEPDTLNRIRVGLLYDLEHAKPASLMASANPDRKPVTLKITFTAYEQGNAVARYVMIGLGQIHVDGDIEIADASGGTIGAYKISKQFALGGIMGAATTIKDVEDGFETSVVELVKDPSQTAESKSRSKPKKNLRPL
jgi:hypothetical protein